MESLTDLKQKITNFRYLPEVIYWVEVTYIRDPGHFYVRLYDYNQYLPILELREFSEDIIPRRLHIQSQIIYFSETLNNHVRGQILYIDNINGESVYNIFALDYGCLDKNVSLKNISKPCYDTRSIQSLVHCCELTHCQPTRGTIWSDSAIDAIKFYVGKVPIRMIVKASTHVLSVELKNESRDDVATLMALTGYSTLGFHMCVNRFAVPEPEKRCIEFKKPSVGDVLHVRVQSITNLDDFYVAEPKDYRNYLQQKPNFMFFTKLLKELPLEDFKVNTPVAVFMFDQCKYERGVVKEIMDSRAKVQLIDWGKVVEVSHSMLKPMSEKFFFYPATAIYCSLVGWTDNMPRVLQPGYEILITIKQVGFRFDKPNLVTVSGVSKNFQATKK